MKLDPRIKAESDILTGSVSDIEKGKQFIGGIGYFANEITAFCDLGNCPCGVLAGSDVDLGDYPYTWHLGERYESFAFYIPDGALKPVKKHRPYTPEEFCDKFALGRPIEIRKNDIEGSGEDLILQGLWYKRRDGKMIAYAHIGPLLIALDDLFYDYEWRRSFAEDFEPFGVEVEE